MRAHTHMRARTHTHRQIGAHIRTHTHTRTYTETDVHIQTHTHTHIWLNAHDTTRPYVRVPIYKHTAHPYVCSHIQNNVIMTKVIWCVLGLMLSQLIPYETRLIHMCVPICTTMSWLPKSCGVCANSCITAHAIWNTAHPCVFPCAQLGHHYSSPIVCAMTHIFIAHTMWNMTRSYRVAKTHRIP